ncbi:MAG: hypothetical protein WBZ37_24765 [Mycobacterium sp.]
MPEVREIPRNHHPFPATGVSRDSNGVPHYGELPSAPNAAPAAWLQCPTTSWEKWWGGS